MYYLDNIGCSHQKSYCYVDSNKNCFFQLRYSVEKKYSYLQRIFFHLKSYSARSG
jgi:hypothetical protein